MPKIGLRLLGESLPKLTPSGDPVAITGLVSEDTGVILTALEAIDERANARDKEGKEHEKLGAGAKKALAELAGFSAPKGAPAPILPPRRVDPVRGEQGARRELTFTTRAWLDATSSRPRLGRGGGDGVAGGLPATTIGARAMVDVLGRAPLEGPRLAAFHAYAEGGELRAREAAVELLGDRDGGEGRARPPREGAHRQVGRADRDGGRGVDQAPAAGEHRDEAGEEAREGHADAGERGRAGRAVGGHRQRAGRARRKPRPFKTTPSWSTG